MPRQVSRGRQSRRRSLPAVLAAAALCLTLLNGCGDAGATGTPEGGPAAGEGGGAGADGGMPQGPPPATVRVGEVEKETVQSRWDVIGRLQEVRRVTVAAEQDGRVVEAPVEEGDRVEGGETLLARIDDVWARLAEQGAASRLAEAEASVAVTEVRLEQARRDLKSLEGLLAAASAKPKEVEDARSSVREEAARLEQARAAVESSRVELARARENLSRLHVVAPFDGVVVAKLTEVGQWLSAGSPVAEVVSRGSIDALIHVPESLVSGLRVGAPVTVRVEPLGLEVPGEVASITPQAATAARTFPVKVRLEDADGRLKPGMSVTAQVPTSEQVEALTVPRDAVQRSPQGTSVWVQVEGKALPVPVRVLFGEGDRFVVEPAPGATGPPLTEGMSVVTEGGEGLFPGRPLIVLDGGTPAGGAG